MTETYPMRELIYRFARSFYLTLKKIFGPSVRTYPRLHRFASAMKTAVKEFIRPPVAVQGTTLQSAPVAACGPEPARHSYEPRSGLPGWMMDEWREIHKLEPQLFPEMNIQFHIITDFIKESRVGKHYPDLCSLFGEKVSHIVLVPWLKTGGADLVAINYVRALTVHKLGGNVVVISTENSDSPWAEKLPREARFVEFGKCCAHLSPEEQEKLLTRLFLQFAPRVIHNINSLLGYNTFIRYGKAIAEISRLYACAFCEDITPEGRSVGYPICFLPRCFDSLTAVFSDNQHILDKLRVIFAFEQEKLFVHYQPMTLETTKPRSRGAVSKNSLDILWASRLDTQKRPDILIRIAERCKGMPFTFHVYGTPVYGTTEKEVQNYVNSLGALPNVRYYGHYDGLTSIPTEDYDIFLYTSQWDGLPNVLLEAASLGMLIVASATGGIPELVDDGKTGFIVNPFDNVDGYVDTLKKIYSDRSSLQEIADSSMKLLRSRHSWTRFIEELRKVPYYAYHAEEVN